MADIPSLSWLPLPLDRFRTFSTITRRFLSTPGSRSTMTQRVSEMTTWFDKDFDSEIKIKQYILAGGQGDAERKFLIVVGNSFDETAILDSLSGEMQPANDEGTAFCLTRSFSQVLDDLRSPTGVSTKRVVGETIVARTAWAEVRANGVVAIVLVMNRVVRSCCLMGICHWWITTGPTDCCVINQ